MLGYKGVMCPLRMSTSLLAGLVESTAASMLGTLCGATRAPQNIFIGATQAASIQLGLEVHMSQPIPNK